MNQSPQPTLGGEVKSAIQVLASVLGLAGYVYLIGGIVSWVRLGAARLPSDVATATLSSRQLFEVGFRSVLLIAVGFTVMCGVAYLAAGWRWAANRSDWHDVMSRRGVAAARSRIASEPAQKAWQVRRDTAVKARRAHHFELLTKAAEKAKFELVRKPAADRKDKNTAAVQQQAAMAAARPPVKHAPLGDTWVRVVAGFNTIVLSVVLGLAVARLIELLAPNLWWLILLIGILAGAATYVVLTLWGPLKWDSRWQIPAWILAGVVAFFVTAPVGLLLIASVVVATLGRTIARLDPPHSLADLVRSPLPWALFTFYALVGLAFYATPPVSFQRVTVSTTDGQRVGAFLSRDSSGLYVIRCTPLADATSSDERVVFINAGDIKQATLGGELWLDSGQRPSLAAFALQAVGFNAHPPTWFRADLRARHAACVGGSPIGLTIGHESPALGAGVLTGPAPPNGQAHNGEPPIERTTPATIARLARRYQPTVEVTVADRFWPVSLGAVLQDINPKNNQPTALCHVGARIRCNTTTSPSALVPSTSTSSDYLRFPAPLNSNPTNQFQAFENGQSIFTGSLHHWLATPDVLDPWYTGELYFFYGGPIRTSSWPARAVDPRVPSGLIGLEYWFFYPFNYYPTVVGASLMQDAPLAGDETNTDLHQGDWEHVTVLLDPKTLSPQWLYMAHHADEGRFYPWSSPSLAFDQGHPIIQAAFGGHPSYDSRCRAQYRPRIANVSADWVVCGSGRFAFRAPSTPLVDLAQTSWACWKGHFGEAKPGLEVNSPGEADNVLTQARKLVFVAGPVSPLWGGENGNLAHNTGPCTGAGPKAAELAAARVGHPSAVR